MFAKLKSLFNSDSSSSNAGQNSSSSSNNNSSSKSKSGSAAGSSGAAVSGYPTPPIAGDLSTAWISYLPMTRLSPLDIHSSVVHTHQSSLVPATSHTLVSSSHALLVLSYSAPVAQLRHAQSITLGALGQCIAAAVARSGIVGVGPEGNITVVSPAGTLLGKTRLPAKDCKVSAFHLIPLSNYAFVGTSRGNIYILDTSKCAFAAHVIGSEKVNKGGKPIVHKASVVALETNPAKRSQLLIGFAVGMIVGYDYVKDNVAFRIDNLATQDLRCAVWHPLGHSFATGLEDGRICLWGSSGIKAEKPEHIMNATASMTSTPRRPITRLLWTLPGVESAADDDGETSTGTGTSSNNSNNPLFQHLFSGSIIAAGGSEKDSPKDSIMLFADGDFASNPRLLNTQQGAALDLALHNSTTLLALVDTPARLLTFNLADPAKETLPLTLEHTLVDPQLLVMCPIPEFTHHWVPKHHMNSANPKALLTGGYFPPEFPDTRDAHTFYFLSGHTDSHVRLWRFSRAAGIRLASSVKTINLVPPQSRTKECGISALCPLSTPQLLVGNQAGDVLLLSIALVDEFDKDSPPLLNFESVVHSGGSPAVTAIAVDSTGKLVLIGNSAGMFTVVDIETTPPAVLFSKKLTSSGIKRIVAGPNSAIYVASGGGSLFFGTTAGKKPAFRCAYEIRLPSESASSGIVDVFHVSSEGALLAANAARPTTHTHNNAMNSTIGANSRSSTSAAPPALSASSSSLASSSTAANKQQLSPSRPSAEALAASSSSPISSPATADATAAGETETTASTADLGSSSTGPQQPPRAKWGASARKAAAALDTPTSPPQSTDQSQTQTQQLDESASTPAHAAAASPQTPSIGTADPEPIASSSNEDRENNNANDDDDHKQEGGGDKDEPRSEPGSRSQSELLSSATPVLVESDDVPEIDFLLVITRTGAVVLALPDAMIVHAKAWESDNPCVGCSMVDLADGRAISIVTTNESHQPRFSLHALMDLSELCDESQLQGIAEAIPASLDSKAAAEMLAKTFHVGGIQAVPCGNTLSLISYEKEIPQPFMLFSMYDPDYVYPEQPALEKTGLLRKKTQLDELIRGITKNPLADQDFDYTPLVFSDTVLAGPSVEALLADSQFLVPRLCSREVSDVRVKVHGQFTASASARDQLLAGASGNGAAGSQQQQQQQSTQGAVGSAHESASRARDQLNERGEKLEQLSMKFDALNRSAMTFADNAKKLADSKK